MRWLLILLLAAVPAAAQEGGATFPPDASGGGGASYDGGSVTNPFLAPDGACAPGNPSYSWTSSPTAGWYKDPDTAVTTNQFTFCAEAGIFGAAGKMFSFARADNGVGQTRTYVRFWDPDAPVQVAGFFQAQSSDWTNATALALKQFDSNFAVTTWSGTSTSNQVEIGDYSTSTTKTGQLTLIGGPTGAGTFLRFSPYDGVNFFYTDLNVTYPTANRVITLPDASGTVALSGAAFGLPDGTQSTPSLYWDTEPGLGWYHVTPTPGSWINVMKLAGAAGTYAPVGDLFAIRQQDAAVGTRVYWLFRNPDDPSSQGSTVQYSMRFQSSQQTATNSFEMNPFGATSGGLTLTSNLTDGNRLAATSTTDSTSNRIEFYGTSAAGDGVDVDVYMGNYDNGGTEYLRLYWPSNPTGTNIITLPDATGTVALTSDIVASVPTTVSYKLQNAGNNNVTHIGLAGGEQGTGVENAAAVLTNRLEASPRTIRRAVASTGGYSWIGPSEDAFSRYSGFTTYLMGGFTTWETAYLNSAVLSLGNTSPASHGTGTPSDNWTNFIAFVVEDNDANYFIAHNGASAGSTTRVDTGIPIVMDELVYFELWADFNDSSVSWRITNYNTSATATGTITTNMPSATTLLYLYNYTDCATGGSVDTDFNIQTMYGEIPSPF